jgi:transcriptional regulator of acetoin/glycerol metabolism
LSWRPAALFLEKIEYLAPELQSILLQVIKQGVVTRLDAAVDSGGC